MDMADNSTAADEAEPEGGCCTCKDKAEAFSSGGNMVDDILSASWYLLLVCVANMAGNDDAGEEVVDVVVVVTKAGSFASMLGPSIALVVVVLVVDLSCCATSE